MNATQIKKEMEAIHKELWVRRILGRVVQAIPTPAYTIYRLDRLPRPSKGEYRIANVSTVSGALRDIQGQLSRLPWHDGGLRVRFDQNGFALEVPTRIKPIRVTDQILAKLRPHRAALGKSYSAHGKRRHWFDLSDETNAHLLIAGSTGSGKSQLLRAVVSTLAYATSPDDLHFVMVDLKNRGLAPFRLLPHVRHWTSDAAEAGRLIGWLRAELERRKDGGSPAPTPRIVLVIDELAELVFAGQDNLFSEAFPSIATRGRELGIHIIAAAQNPSKDIVGPQMRTQFTTKVIGHLEDGRVASHITGRVTSGAEALPGKGSMLLIQGGAEPIRIQSYLLDNVDLLVGRSVEHWQGRQAPPIDLALQPLYDAPAKGRNMQDDLERAWPVFDRYARWDVGQPEPALKHGGKKAIIQAVFGEGADTGGYNDKYAGELISYMKDNYHAR